MQHSADTNATSDDAATAKRGSGNLPAPIYLDYQATTPVDPRVFNAMLPWFNAQFGNAHSQHQHGWQADEAVERARAQVAAIIGAQSREVVITSGATESNNLAIKGVAKAYGDKRNHIVTCVTEHKCVLESCLQMEREGFEVTRLEVDRNGFIDLDQLRAAVTEKTILVSIMAVNNEIGIIHPLREIGEICRMAGVFFHTDAAQAVGKIPLDVEAANIDLMSISGHKIYGPKGVGALYVRRRPRVRLEVQMSGGGQERGLRSGTLPTPLCVGLGIACMIAEREMAAENLRIGTLRDRLYQRLMSELDNVSLNGDAERRISGNLNLSFARIDGAALMMGIPDLSVSTGSACASGSLGPSYVLQALGLDAEGSDTALRIGLGRFTTKDEVDYAADRLIAVVSEQRSHRSSPSPA
jgi:cysteine desulfurase